MSTLLAVTRFLNRQWTCVVLLITAGFILLCFVTTSQEANKNSPKFKFFENQRHKTRLSSNVELSTIFPHMALNKDKVKGDAEVSSTEACKLDRKFMPEGSMPLILLLSFPGSGNTWVRFLIERSTGIYSGCRHNAVGTGDNDTSIWRKSNPCLKQTVIVKSHEWKDFDNPQGKKCQPEGAILLIRNPYGAILAEYNRQKSGKTGTAPTSEFKGQEWTKFAKSTAKQWSKSIQEQLNMIQQLLIVFYENLVKNTEHEIRRMLNFLQVPQNETRITCLLQNTTGNFKRAHKNVSFNPFSADINKTIDENIRNLRNFMESRFNYTLPPYHEWRLQNDAAS